MTKTLDGYLGIQPKKKKEPEKVIPSVTLDQFGENDWTFKTGDTQEFTHTIFNEYPARMIPQIARKLINLYYPKYKDRNQKKSLLDPFAGSGTSCTEALLQDIDSIAFDLNPLANLIEKVKTAIIPPPDLKSVFKKIMGIINENRVKSFPEYIPKELDLNYWYKEEVRRELSVISYAINSVLSKQNLQNIPNLDDIRNFFLVCFCKTARYGGIR